MDKKCVLVANKEMDYCIKEFPNKYKNFVENFDVISHNEFKTKGLVIIDKNNNIIDDINDKKNYSLARSKYNKNYYIALSEYENNIEAVISKIVYLMGATNFERIDNVTISDKDKMNLDINMQTNLKVDSSINLNANTNAQYSKNNSFYGNSQSALSAKGSGQAKKTKEELKEYLEREGINHKLFEPELANLVEIYLETGNCGVDEFEYTIKLEEEVKNNINFMLELNIKTDAFNTFDIDLTGNISHSKEIDKKKIIEKRYKIKFN